MSWISSLFGSSSGAIEKTNFEAAQDDIDRYNAKVLEINERQKENAQKFLQANCTLEIRATTLAYEEALKKGDAEFASELSNRIANLNEKCFRSHAT